MSEEIKDKIEELKILEGQLHGLLVQKQSAQLDMNEIENALEEIKNSEEIYKVVAGVMIKSTKDKLTKELNEKKRVLKMSVDSIEKQERIIKKNALELKNEVNKSIK